MREKPSTTKSRVACRLPLDIRPNWPHVKGYQDAQPPPIAGAQTGERQMQYLRNEYLFPLPLGNRRNLPELERQLTTTVLARRGQLVSAFARMERAGDELVVPVWWPLPRPGQAAHELIAERVAALALLCAREGSVLRGFR